MAPEDDAEFEVVRGELEVMVAELMAFHDIVADDLGEGGAAALRFIIGLPADDCVVCGDRRYSVRDGRCQAHRLYVVR